MNKALWLTFKHYMIMVDTFWISVVQDLVKVLYNIIILVHITISQEEGVGHIYAIFAIIQLHDKDVEYSFYS